MADKEERPAAETEVTPKKQKITKSKKINHGGTISVNPHILNKDTGEDNNISQADRPYYRHSA